MTKSAKSAKKGKGSRRTEIRRIVHLVQRAIDEGADSVEEIHRSIASMPLDVLERLDVFEQTVKDVREVQDASIGKIYEVIHQVNHEVGKLAAEALGQRAVGGAVPKKAPARSQASRARAR
jgi:methyl-accepting chemotaxis protein